MEPWRWHLQTCKHLVMLWLGTLRNAPGAGGSGGAQGGVGDGVTHSQEARSSCRRGQGKPQHINPGFVTVTAQLWEKSCWEHNGVWGLRCRSAAAHSWTQLQQQSHEGKGRLVPGEASPQSSLLSDPWVAPNTVNNCCGKLN